MKDHCLKALWLCRCVQACLTLGVWSHKWGGGVSGVLGGIEISLKCTVLDDKNSDIYEKNAQRDANTARWL